MRKKPRRLVYILIATGVIVVGLLFFAINREPLFRVGDDGLDIGAVCLWCGDEGPLSFWDVAGTAFIVLLMVLIPSGHIALLIMLAGWVQRPPQSPSRHHTSTCVHCGGEVLLGWKACPHCGEKL